MSNQENSTSKKLKVLLKAPILTMTGYGEHARFILSALRTREDFEIFILPTPWGVCRWLVDEDEERIFIEDCMRKTSAYMQTPKFSFDISVQVILPTEWARLAPVNIGVTSAIEADHVIPSWNKGAEIVDLIIVESEHAKSTFNCKTPIEVISFPHRSNIESEEIPELKIETDFNFLLMGQWVARKNLDKTLIGFWEEFCDNEDVGLVAKINMASDSNIDYMRLKKTLVNIKSQVAKVKGREIKCKLYFLFGDVNKKKLVSLYTHEKIKAMITMTHGEGFGLPLFEAACNGMPLILPPWSGQMDYITMPDEDGKPKVMSAKIDYVMDNIKPEDCWINIMDPSQVWCYPSIGSLKKKMREVYKNYGPYKKNALKLRDYLVEKLPAEKQNSLIVESILGAMKKKESNK